MGNYYSDEEVSLKLIGIINRSAGNTKKTYLKELCRFKTEAADSFWAEKLRDPEYLPYVMMSRSKSFSDYAARHLSDLTDRLLAGEYDRIDAANEAYFLLNACMFKESDAFIEVCRKIGKNCHKLRSINISWRGRILSGGKLPEFLAERRKAEEENDSETELTAALVDMICVTAANAVKTDGEYETFTPKVMALCEEFPELYAPVGLFLYFISDTAQAYDKFSSYMHDPLMYPKLLWMLAGLGYNSETHRYEQGTPVMFTGPDNEKTHFFFELESIDFRWYEFITEKILSDAENVTVCDPYYAKAFCRKFTSLLLRIMNPKDENIMNACRGYFRRSAVIAGNPADFAGLQKCGVISSGEELTKLALEIAERIAAGRQSYCFHLMMSFFSDFDRSEKLAALTDAAEYLTEHDKSERLLDQRFEFFKQLELMVNGQPNVFEANPAVRQ